MTDNLENPFLEINAPIYAHFRSGRRKHGVLIQKATVEFTRGPSMRGLCPGAWVEVSGPREARKIAAERGAICWNF